MIPQLPQLPDTHKTAEYNEGPRTSSASTLEDRQFKGKHHEDGEISHAED
jgi:hypothetical protein